MDVREILDAPAASLARVASTAAGMVDDAVARVDHTVPLPGHSARRRRHVRRWVARNRRPLLVVGGLGVVAAAAVAVKGRRPTRSTSAFTPPASGYRRAEEAATGAHGDSGGGADRGAEDGFRGAALGGHTAVSEADEG